MLFGDEGQTELKCALQTCYALELSCIGKIIQEKGWKFPSRYSFNCISFTSLAHFNHYFAHFEVLFQKDLMAYQTYQILSLTLALQLFYKFCKQVLMYNMLPRFLRCWLYSCCTHGSVTNFPIKPIVLATAARSVHFSCPSEMLNENLLSNDKYFKVSLSDKRKQLQD